MKMPKITVLALFLAIVLGPWSPGRAADDAALSDAELEQMLAPIALYPDTVLSHILIASTYPLEVVQAARWIKANRDLSGEAAVAAVENKDWDPSVKALVAFPQIIDRMNEDLEWMQALGDAFLLDETQVLASIQNLRQRAYAAGNLDSLEHVDVQRESQTIIIEPAVKQVVYVPYYDTRVVYGTWHWHDYPPLYWDYPGHYHRSSHRSSFYWGSGVRVSSTFFFSSFHWQRRHLVVVHLHDYDYWPHHFYTGRQVAHYRNAHHWQHNPRHRRGASYGYSRLNRDYGRGHGHHRDEPDDGRNKRWEPTGVVSGAAAARLRAQQERSTLTKQPRGTLRTTAPQTANTTATPNWRDKRHVNQPASQPTVAPAPRKRYTVPQQDTQPGGGRTQGSVQKHNSGQPSTSTHRNKRFQSQTGNSRAADGKR